jgi:serine/threonine protein phosphatase PrpC
VTKSDVNVLLCDRVAGDQRLGDREKQEDSFLVLDLRESGGCAEDSALLLLADGMGGHEGGAVASELAVNAFANSYVEASNEGSRASRLKNAMDAATQAIAVRVEAENELRGMGCTLVAAVIKEDRLEWLSIGDSPLWLLRNGALTRLNKDHSMKPMLDAMVDAGELTAEEAAVDGRRNALRSALDGREPELVDLQTDGYLLQSGDVILLASDGVESLSEQEIVRLLAKCRREPVSVRLKKLLDEIISLSRPYQDNATAILFDPALSAASVSATGAKTRLNINAQPHIERNFAEDKDAPSEKDISSTNGLISKPSKWMRQIGIAMAILAIIVALGLLSLAINSGNDEIGSGDNEQRVNINASGSERLVEGELGGFDAEKQNATDVESDERLEQATENWLDIEINEAPVIANEPALNASADEDKGAQTDSSDGEK